MIHTLNLNSDLPTTFLDYSLVEYEEMRFPSGEINIHIKTHLDKTHRVVVIFRFQSMSDVMKLVIAVDALRRQGVHRIVLFMPYIPFARQDRVTREGEALTIKLFSDMVNDLSFDGVIVYDPHSDVAPALFDNIIPINNHALVLAAIRKEYSHKVDDGIWLVSPDAGASKKTYGVYQSILDFSNNNLDFPSLLGHVQGTKKRNLLTGEVSGFMVNQDDLGGCDCWIVDDICSRGGTFMGLSTELKKRNAGDVYLVVSHYEGTADVKRMSEFVKRIYTTDSMIFQEDEQFVRVVRIQDMIDLSVFIEELWSDDV